MAKKKLLNGTALLTRTAAESRNFRVMRRIICGVMACIAVLMTLIYTVSVMYSKYGGFSISVNKYHQLQYGLTLSENAMFTNPTASLNCDASEDITNIDGKSLDELDLGAIDGDDSGANHLCYTFYCKNAGERPVTVDYAINISKMTLDIEKAVRIRLITNYNGKNKKQVDYARAAGVDENGNSIPEEGTTAFFGKNTVMQDTLENFQPGDVQKFTVVIWLEGNDPDCVDAILGGEFKIDMKFTVVAVDEEPVA